jgi:hypothetical protein
MFIRRLAKEMRTGNKIYRKEVCGTITNMMVQSRIRRHQEERRVIRNGKGL